MLAEPGLDVFHGIWSSSTLPGGHRFVDAEECGDIFERGAVLKLDAAPATSCPSPRNAAAMEVSAEDLAGGDEKHPKLRRAWDLISGKDIDDK